MDKQNRRHRPADLASWRSRLNLTQAEVADMMGVNQSTVCDIEKGKNRNAITIALLIATLERAEASMEPTEMSFSLDALVLSACGGALFGAALVSTVTLMIV